MKKLILINLILLSTYVWSASNFSITLVPHGISMAAIPDQKATAGSGFNYNFKSAINYYDENQALGYPVKGIIDPDDLKKLKEWGLNFNAVDFSITGTPNKYGSAIFKIGAQNINVKTAYTQLKINVAINPKDKPKFKTSIEPSTATPGQNYHLDLKKLLENNQAFGDSNPVYFRLDAAAINPSWVAIKDSSRTFLDGIPDLQSAGITDKVTIIATSNTGGDSMPYTLEIPIAQNPLMKPTMKEFSMHLPVEQHLYQELGPYVTDPALDSSLRVVIDKVEPEGAIYMSPSNPLVLEGDFTKVDTGKKYWITLHANTRMGGASNPIRVPLQIHINKDLTPRFIMDKPRLDRVFLGQEYMYDFLTNDDVYPRYEDVPYTIKFADKNHPEWLILENNKLVSNGTVPNDIEETRIKIYLILTNVPGGNSEIKTLSLVVMN